MPVFGGGTTRFQPVYAGDIARAVEIASRTLDKEAVNATNGKVIEAGGPDGASPMLRIAALDVHGFLKCSHTKK